MRSTYFLRALILLGLVCWPGIGAAQTANPDIQRVQRATQVLEQIVMAPDRGIPKGLMRGARAIAVIPGVVKAGLFLAGRYGEGLISIRRTDGSWSLPAFIRFVGASFGFQAGVSSTDVILVFRTQRGVNRLVHGEFTLGADITVAAGPVGRYFNAGTTPQFNAEIYSYSRSQGLFAGVALNGARISIDDAADQRLYGQYVTARRVFEGQIDQVPSAVQVFRSKLEEYTK